jgi:hypothetical protein
MKLFLAGLLLLALCTQAGAQDSLVRKPARPALSKKEERRKRKAQQPATPELGVGAFSLGSPQARNALAPQRDSIPRPIKKEPDINLSDILLPILQDRARKRQ